MMEASAYWYKTHNSLAHSTMFFILCPYGHNTASHYKKLAFPVLNSGLNLNTSQKLLRVLYSNIY